MSAERDADMACFRRNRLMTTEAVAELQRGFRPAPALFP